MCKVQKLTDAEVAVMKILWEHEDGMTIQEIVQYQEQNQLSTASTAQIVKHLLKKEAVRVNGFVPAANVYARKFVPCFSREEFGAAEIQRVQQRIFDNGKLQTLGIAAAFLGNMRKKKLSGEEIEELKKLVDKKTQE